MPINNTKYNKITQFQIDISNSSYFYSCLGSGSGSRHILTCDPSDTLLGENQPYKIYLGSKASHLIHPFSQVSNYQSQLDNSNSVFRVKIPEKVHIDPSNVVQRQKQMQNVVGTYSSNYTMNLASLHVNNENGKPGDFWNNKSDRLVARGKGKNAGIDVKHGSYDRYLARKKSGFLKTENIDNGLVPRYGNKTMKFGLVNSGTCLDTC